MTSDPKPDPKPDLAPGHGLAIALDDIADVVLVPKKYLTGGSVTAKIAYGADMSMMVATRVPGYHSKPHAHDAEQLNYVMAGELYVFIDRVAVHARRGDIVRIPRNAVHWSWVQGSEPCTLLEVHTPPLLGDPGVKEGSTPLFAEGENPEVVAVPSQWFETLDRAEVERAALGEALYETLSATTVPAKG